MKNLRELALHYQTTGELLPEVAEYQLEYLLNNMQDIYQEYIDEYSQYSPPFEEHVRMRVNDWLILNGFVTEEIFEEVNDIISGLDDEEAEALLNILNEDESGDYH